MLRLPDMRPYPPVLESVIVIHMGDEDPEGVAGYLRRIYPFAITVETREVPCATGLPNGFSSLTSASLGK